MSRRLSRTVSRNVPTQGSGQWGCALKGTHPHPNVPNLRICPELPNVPNSVSRETHSCKTCGKSFPEVEFYLETNGRVKAHCKRCWYLKQRASLKARVEREELELRAPIVTNRAAAKFLGLRW